MIKKIIIKRGYKTGLEEIMKWNKTAKKLEENKKETLLEKGTKKGLEIIFIKKEDNTIYKNITYMVIGKICQTLTQTYGSGAIMLILKNMGYFTPRNIKEETIKSAMGYSLKGLLRSTAYIIRKPLQITNGIIGKNKGKIGGGGLGGGTSLELVKRLEETGAVIVEVNNNKYIINANVKEAIDQQITILEGKGINISEKVMKDFIEKGQGVKINKNILEPVLKEMPIEQKEEIYRSVNIGSNEIPEKALTYSELPGLIKNPIGAVKNIKEYTDIILDLNNNSGFGGGSIIISGLIIVASIFTVKIIKEKEIDVQSLSKEIFSKLKKGIFNRE